ncbi:hypothetical protein [Candidatus Thiosymbion oneisti]|uniref:hypothetical protein n=1 Tax=Candidatus Thiosymbion oneisti TaxID=589554 RepID=UPI001A9C7D51|nr:hypothetical protein [Candidatus Thiosymbion oneisti]
MLRYAALDAVLPQAFPRAADTTYKQGSARADRAGDNVGVGCVKTLAPTWQAISEPLSVATQHARSPKQR